MMLIANKNAFYEVNLWGKIVNMRIYITLLTYYNDQCVVFEHAVFCSLSRCMQWVDMMDSLASAAWSATTPSPTAGQRWPP